MTIDCFLAVAPRDPGLDVGEMRGLLSRRERSVLASIRSPRAGRDFLESRLLLRFVTEELLGRRAAVEVERGSGRVHATRPDLGASLSHCPSHVAATVSTGSRVGIDVECAPNYLPSVARRRLTADEVGRIEALAVEARPAAFRRAWSLMEASFKAHIGDRHAGGTRSVRVFEPTASLAVAHVLVGSSDGPAIVDDFLLLDPSWSRSL